MNPPTKTPHLDPLRERLRAMRVLPPPAPWRPPMVLAVGGLEAIGFDRHSELLLVSSTSGRGVIDCATGIKVARDPEEFENDGWLETRGIGPLAGKTLRMSGLYGGGLPVWTSDRWSIEVVTLDWPTSDVVLVEPSSSLFASFLGRDERLHKIASESELRACGFSFTGKTLVIATASDVAVYRRGED